MNLPGIQIQLSYGHRHVYIHTYTCTHKYGHKRTPGRKDTDIKHLHCTIKHTHIYVHVTYSIYERITHQHTYTDTLTHTHIQTDTLNS